MYREMGGGGGGVQRPDLLLNESKKTGRSKAKTYTNASYCEFDLLLYTVVNVVCSMT